MKTRYFDLAKKLSHKSEHKFKLGAVIVKGNRVMGIGYNSTKTHPKAKTRFKTLHAEHDALLDTGLNDVKGATAYVYRETKDGCPACAKPCPACQEIFKTAGIKKVYYSVENYPYWEAYDCQ